MKSARIEIYSEFVFYVPVGDKSCIDNIRNILEEENVDKNIKYLSLKLFVPLSMQKEIIDETCESLLEPIVEETHANVYSNHPVQDAYMLIVLIKEGKKTSLSFLKIMPEENLSLEKIIIKQFSKLGGGKIEKDVYSSIKPIAVVGRNKDTLVYMSKIKKCSKNNKK